MLRIRQVVLITADLDAAGEAARSALRLDRSESHPDIGLLGLEHAMAPVGDTFLEIVTPVRPDVTAARFLQRHGEGGYMLILQVDELAGPRSRAEALGVPVVAEYDTGDWASIHLHPKQLGGPIVSLDVADPPESFSPSGPTWRDHIRTELVSAIVGAEIRCPDAAGTAARWARVLGTEPVDELTIRLDAGTLRFSECAAGDRVGISTLDMTATDPAARGTELRICGVRVRLL